MFRNSAQIVSLATLLGLLAVVAYFHQVESCRPSPAPTASTGAVATPEPASPQREFQARYDAMCAAMKAKDPKAYLEFLHENYKDIDEKGNVLGRKDEANLKRAFEEMEKAKATLSVKVVDCQVKDNRATVNTEQVMAGSMPDPKDATKNHEIVCKAQTRDTWTRTGTGWKLLREKIVKTSMTIDGKSPEEYQKSQDRGKAGNDTEDKGDNGEDAEKPADEKGEKPEGGDKGE